MSKRHVSFVLGGESYCVPVDQVLQILRSESILRIPKAPPFVVGVVNLRGDVIPVVDLHTRLGLRAEEALRRRRVVVVQVGRRGYGMLVDEVKEIVDLEEGAVTDEAAALSGTRVEFVSAVAHRGESTYLILDLPKIFSAGAVAIRAAAAPGEGTAEAGRGAYTRAALHQEQGTK